MAYTADNLTVPARVFIARHMVRDGDLLLGGALWGVVVANEEGPLSDPEDGVYVSPTLNGAVRAAVRRDLSFSLEGVEAIMRLVPNPVVAGSTRWKAVWVDIEATRALIGDGGPPEDTPDDPVGDLPAFITGP